MASASEKKTAKPAAESYWAESRSPLVSLVFVAPLLVTYELGVLFLGSQNGADAFMRAVLDSLGFTQHFLLPILTVGILLGWQYLSRMPWRLSAGVLPAMAAESILLAIGLWLLLIVQKTLFIVCANPEGMSIGGTFRDAVGYLGAGVYEELLFRLILLSSVAWLLRNAGFKPPLPAIGSVVLTSLLFSAAHYQCLSVSGEPFQWFSFTFRFLAGVFFSIVFVYRGFGIAAGTHAAYNTMIWLAHLAT